jgi:hypothetical protein
MRRDNNISSEVFATMADILDPQMRVKKAKDECVLEALASLDNAALMLEEEQKFALAEAVNQIMEVIPTKLAQESLENQIEKEANKFLTVKAINLLENKVYEIVYSYSPKPLNQVKNHLEDKFKVKLSFRKSEEDGVVPDPSTWGD